MELDANFQAKVIAGLAGYGEQKKLEIKLRLFVRKHLEIENSLIQ